MSTQLTTCAVCRYVKAGELQKDLTKQWFCCRFPPVPLAVAQTTTRGTQVQVLNVNPVVAPDHTCGEFALLPTAPG